MLVGDDDDGGGVSHKKGKAVGRSAIATKQKRRLWTRSWTVSLKEIDAIRDGVVLQYVGRNQQFTILLRNLGFETSYKVTRCHLGGEIPRIATYRKKTIIFHLPVLPPIVPTRRNPLELLPARQISRQATAPNPSKES